MNESRCYVDSAVLAEHQPFNRNGKALRCDYPKRALYRILHTLYAFNGSTRQRVGQSRSIFQTIFPIFGFKIRNTRTDDFRFFFVIKTTKRNNEERKGGRCSGTSNSGQNCWTTERYRDANHPLLALSLCFLHLLRYIVARAKNLPRFLKLRGYKHSLS